MREEGERDVQSSAIAGSHALTETEMSALIEAFDWSKTPLGPASRWSPTLRIMNRLMLANRFPMLLWWGPAYTSIYNDAYIPVLGAKHSWALGKPVSECWSEIWHILKPLIDTPFHGGPATWNDDIELEINRNGYPEETHFTVAYSPVPDDMAPGGIGGVLATVTEITEKVIGERRVAILADLASRTSDARTPVDACSIAAQTLAEHKKDVPFALIYLTDAGQQVARLAGCVGIERSQSISPETIQIGEESGRGWRLPALDSTLAVDNIDQRFPDFERRDAADFPSSAVVLSIPTSGAAKVAGFLVVGISPHLRFDERYRDFLQMMNAQIASAISNARSYEEERLRAEALAEIDRAKTVFFSNISHEFRTPLTLMLGQIDDVVGNSELADGDRERLTIAHRNSLRMLKLVNTLLEFSRIEAGRAQVNFEETDLASATSELASVFRSATEQAGLRLVVNTPRLAESAYIDRDMWEKIVLNLLSNAFKFTLQGEIVVTLCMDEGAFVLTIRDTGIGIPSAEMPKLFERFHRVEGAAGRTREGSGIGLAFVQELVRLHGGTISAESEEGKGTTFRVLVPRGFRHLPGERIANSPASAVATGAAPFIAEALRWLPDNRESFAYPDLDAPAADRASGKRRRLLVVDDNADMRDYLRRLLHPHYEIEIVADGNAALDAAERRTPDLVLSDIMLPGIDGLQLVRQLRSDTRSATTPIMLLSARAGEEARVEGLRAGADDYMIKPFSARELLARRGPPETVSLSGRGNGGLAS